MHPENSLIAFQQLAQLMLIDSLESLELGITVEFLIIRTPY